MMTIAVNEIESILVLGESLNRVLIVKQRNSNRPIIVKSENTTAMGNADYEKRENLGAMLQFHGTVLSKLRALPFDVERVTLNEIAALRAVTPLKVTGMDTGETWPAVFDSALMEGKGKQLPAQINVAPTFEKSRKSLVKITYIEELADLSKITKNAIKIQAMRDELETGDADFVFELGQICAVDFFIGNHDRFAEDGGLRGPQNVFFSLKNGTIQATGIDTYDNDSWWSNLNRTIEDIEEKTGQKWPGRILAPGAVKLRDAICEEAVSKILQMCYEGGITGREQFPAPCTLSIVRRKSLVKLFHKGMSDGKKILRQKYSLSDNLASLSEGIRSRWKIIRG